MMNNRFFIKFAATNIKKNGKSYIPYILISIFIVTMFYIIKSLSLNPGPDKMLGADTLNYIMRLGSMAAALFALVFLFYANSFLIRHRKKEFAVFHILGMEKRHLAKTLAWEINTLFELQKKEFGDMASNICYLFVPPTKRLRNGDYYGKF